MQSINYFFSSFLTGKDSSPLGSKLFWSLVASWGLQKQKNALETILAVSHGLGVAFSLLIWVRNDYVCSIRRRGQFPDSRGERRPKIHPTDAAHYVSGCRHMICIIIVSTSYIWDDEELEEE